MVEGKLIKVVLKLVETMARVVIGLIFMLLWPILNLKLLML